MSQNIKKLPEGWPSTMGGMYAEGASDTEIRSELKMSKGLWDSLYNDPASSSFKEVVDFGRELAKGWWLKQGRVNLKSKQFNATLWHMNMKNRYGWSDKTEVTTKDAAEMSSDELEKAVQAASEKIKRMRIG
jgi:hypothetical protein